MPSRQPNVILFFTDQQRHDSTGLHGNPLGLTPHFDRLARAGTHVAHAFTCQPVCGPARACLQTGTYATTNGSWRNGIGLNPDRQRFPTLATCFNNAGYRTGYIGKWHLAGKDGLADQQAGERGPVLESHRGGYQDWLAAEALEFSVHEYKTILYDHDNQPHRLPGYRSDALTDAAIRYIDSHQDQPFFLMTSFIEPHHQNHVDDYPPPEGYREMYTGRWTPPDLAALPAYNDGDDRTGGTTQAHLGGYWGMVKRLDENLGRIVDALISLDLIEDTIILFTSDHACHFKTRNSEYKRSCHESSIRVPTLFHGPGFMGGGQLPQLVSLVDLPPTLLDACGIKVPAGMQGRSLLPLLRRDPQAIAEWPSEAFVQISESHIGRAVRTHRWKYEVTAEDDDGQGGASTYREAILYDLKYDPHELTNLIDRDSHTAVRAVMRDRLLRRMADAGEAEPRIIEAEPKGSGQRYVTEAETRA
jgi:arylsulfatase A-like enzyme